MKNHFKRFVVDDFYIRSLWIIKKRPIRNGIQESGITFYNIFLQENPFYSCCQDYFFRIVAAERFFRTDFNF